MMNKWGTESPKENLEPKSKGSRFRENITRYGGTMLSLWENWWNYVVEFKELHSLILLIPLAVLLLYQESKQNDNKVFVRFVVIIGVLLFVPLFAIPLEILYTGFYDWNDLFVLLPVAILLPYACVLSLEYLKGKRVCWMLALVILLLAGTDFRVFTDTQAMGENGIPKEATEVFQSVEELMGEEEFQIAAPTQILAYTRLYDVTWKPAYGRDLWERDGAKYISSSYTWEYELYNILEALPLDAETAERLRSIVLSYEIDCLIVRSYWVEVLGEIPGKRIEEVSENFVAYVDL